MKENRTNTPCMDNMSKAIVAFAVAGIMSAVGAQGGMPSAAQDGLGAGYAPEKWNVEAREKFAAQRFGIFIHWGLYADYAQGEWYQHDIGIDSETYGRIKDGFCPSRFDAKEWVRVFKDAGAKYVTITSRHHDGFSLWPTKADDGFNIAETPFKRDILGELSEACDEAGLQLNFYYSLMDWHRKDYPPGKSAKKVLGAQKGDYASYKRFMLAQIGELIDSYHPGCIWFDGEWEHVTHQKDGSGRLPARAVEVMAEVGKWMRQNGDAIYGTRGLGLVKNADGTETGTAKKNGIVYKFTIRKGAYPEVVKNP